MHPDDARTRQRIGDTFITGEGIEIGAGLEPSNYVGVTRLRQTDKRTRLELSEWFGRDVGYDVAPLATIISARPLGYDFIVAHQVFEHIHNPVPVLQEWLGALREGGLLYMSVPDAGNWIEEDRLVTPLEHLLDDHFLGRGEDAYESRQHIASFRDQWAKKHPDRFPAATSDFVEVSLAEARRDGHDLHWHTYSQQVLCDFVRCAFHLAGASAHIEHVEVAFGGLHLVCRKNPQGRPPYPLRRYRRRLAAAAASAGASVPRRAAEQALASSRAMITAWRTRRR